MKNKTLWKVISMVSCLLVAYPNSSPGEASDIYGPEGEKWQEAGGPLPDFSYAGYQRGEKPLPARTPDVSVKDYGAIGDGESDDTAAIQKAIDENPGKTIHLPAGRYLLSDVVKIKESGTVLQGDGPDQTILFAPVPLQEIHPLPVSYPDTGGTAYAHSGGFLSVVGSTSYFSSGAQKVTAPAKRGDALLELSEGHSFKSGDEVVVLAHDSEGQTLLRYLYRDEAGDLSKAGADRSFRHVSRVLEVTDTSLTLERPLRIELREDWNPEVRLFQPRVTEIGIEHLAFEFPDAPYLGHFTERGFNAIQMIGIAHSWVRNVAIRNADSGIKIAGSAFCTVTGIVIESERRANNPRDTTGHHGISLTSLDCLCTDFEFRTKFIHDLTVSNGSVGNVFSKGRGPDLALDHHKKAPYENLFSNLDLGRGERMFNSGGSDAIGRHAGAGNTYWNLLSKSSVEIPEEFGPSRLNFIGVKTRARSGTEPEGRWVESLRAGSVEPPDLHAAQLARRLGGSAGVNGKAGTTEEPIRDWTNLEGQSIRARFGGLEGQDVLLILGDGKAVRYPLEKLSDESRNLARELTTP